MANTPTNLYEAAGGIWKPVRVESGKRILRGLELPAGKIVDLWKPPGGKKVRLLRGNISTSTQCSLMFLDNTLDKILYLTPYLVAGVPYKFELRGDTGLGERDNNVLRIVSMASTIVTGTIFGSEDD